MLTANKAREIAIDNSKLEKYLADTLLLIELRAKAGNMTAEIEVPEMYLKPLVVKLRKLGYRVQIMTNVIGRKIFQTLQISWK